VVEAVAGLAAFTAAAVFAGGAAHVDAVAAGDAVLASGARFGPAEASLVAVIGLATGMPAADQGIGAALAVIARAAAMLTLGAAFAFERAVLEFSRVTAFCAVALVAAIGSAALLVVIAAERSELGVAALLARFADVLGLVRASGDTRAALFFQPVITDLERPAWVGGVKDLAASLKQVEAIIRPTLVTRL